MSRLAGKVALITGTGVGMGSAAALRFAAEGATVVGCDLNPQTSAETVRLVRERWRQHDGLLHRSTSRSFEATTAWVDDAADATAASTCCTTTPRSPWSARGTT